jgi:hypothetical protein
MDQQLRKVAWPTLRNSQRGLHDLLPHNITTDITSKNRGDKRETPRPPFLAISHIDAQLEDFCELQALIFKVYVVGLVNVKVYA